MSLIFRRRNQYKIHVTFCVQSSGMQGMYFNNLRYFLLPVLQQMSIRLPDIIYLC